MTIIQVPFISMMALVSILYMQTLESTLPDAIILPSGDHDNAFTREVCLIKSCAGCN